jgi:hypothetical protein
MYTLLTEGFDLPAKGEEEEWIEEHGLFFSQDTEMLTDCLQQIRQLF